MELTRVLETNYIFFRIFSTEKKEKIPLHNIREQD